MTLSAYVIAATILILVIYDIIIGTKQGAKGTLSVAAYRAAQKWPAVPMWMGILCGHLFVSQNTFVFDLAKQWPGIAFAGGYLSAWAFMQDNAVFRFAQRYPVFPLMVGIFDGYAFASLVF